MGTLSHALLAGVRRRYRDLALLKTLGLLRGQLLRVVFWEASTLAGAALLVGLPLGVIAGRWAWVIFARSAGVAPQADVPVPLVLLAIPATLAAGQPHRGRARLDRGPGAGRHRAAERVMGALRLTLRAELRRRWRPMLMLALLLGITGGVVLTAAAGAVRTDTAYPRLLRWANAAQVNVIVKQAPVPAFFAALRRLPQVTAVSAQGLFNFTLPARHGPPAALVETFSSPDGSMGRTADRLKMLDGQLPDPARPDTAVIDQDLAAREHLRPGGTLHLLMIPNTKGGIPDLGRARAMSFRVTGIAVFDSQIVPATKANAEPTVLLSPGFYRSAAARDSTNGSQAGVRLRPGVSVASFAHAAAALARRYPATGGVIVVSLQDEAAATQRAIHPQAVALAVFAALVALIALAVIGQLLSRQLSLDSAEYPVLSALGMSRATLAALSLARLAMVTAAGAVLAVVIAIAASPLMPIGPARLAEPHPGTDVNLAVLGAGLALIAGLPLLLLAAVVWRNAARAAGPPGPADPAGPRGGFPARRGPRPARIGAGQHRRADGVRAGTRPDRRAGPQRARGHDRGGHVRGRRPGLRGQPDSPGLHPAPVRAALAAGAGSGVRGRARAVAVRHPGPAAGPGQLCDRQLR